MVVFTIQAVGYAALWIVVCCIALYCMAYVCVGITVLNYVRTYLYVSCTHASIF